MKQGECARTEEYTIIRGEGTTFVFTHSIYYNICFLTSYEYWNDINTFLTFLFSVECLSIKMMLLQLSGRYIISVGLLPKIMSKKDLFHFANCTFRVRPRKWEKLLCNSAVKYEIISGYQLILIVRKFEVSMSRGSRLESNVQWIAARCTTSWQEVNAPGNFLSYQLALSCSVNNGLSHTRYSCVLFN